MGNSNSNQAINTENDTIHWNNLKTEDMSSVNHNLRGGLSVEAKELIKNLNLNFNNRQDTEIPSFNFNTFLNKKFNIENNNNFEDSPFISSENYNKMFGGAPKKNSKKNSKKDSKKWKGKNEDEDDLSTSSTDDNKVDLISDVEHKKEHKKEKKEHKKEKKVVESESESDSDLKSESDNETDHTGGSRKLKKTFSKNDEYLSYVSSSAHTGGGSISNENEYLISSINTSDINLISED